MKYEMITKRENKMKINVSKLQAASDLNPTKKSQTMTISELSNLIEDGKLTIPMYQRGLSWNDEKVVALFNYQLFGKAPVAPLSLNAIGSNDDVPQLSFVTRELIDGDGNEGKMSVVDGQQRLTTNYKAYSNDETFDNIVLDFTQAKFKKINGQLRENQIPVGILLNKQQSVLQEHIYNKLSSTEANQLFPIAISVRTKLLSYSYTVHIAGNMTENEQIEWFEVLNNAGSRVTMIELALSKFKVHDFDMYTKFINIYKKKVADYGFEELFSPFSSNVSYPIASLNPAFEKTQKNGVHNKNYAPIPSDTKENMLIRLSKDELETISKDTLNGLNRALDFIFDNNLQDYIAKMQHIMYLTGYFVFVEEKNVQDSNLINWIKTVSFDNITNGEKRDIYNDLISNNI